MCYSYIYEEEYCILLNASPFSKGLGWYILPILRPKEHVACGLYQCFAREADITQDMLMYEILHDRFTVVTQRVRCGRVCKGQPKDLVQGPELTAVSCATPIRRPMGLWWTTEESIKEAVESVLEARRQCPSLRWRLELLLRTQANLSFLISFLLGWVLFTLEYRIAESI